MQACSSRVPSARVHVVRGDRPRQLLFAAGVPARVTVGSDVDAELSMRGPEVAPRQLDIVWDGTNLWLEDALRLGRTFVNGQLLNGWIAVLGQALVSFGPVRLWLLANGCAPSGQAPDFNALEHAQLLSPGVTIDRRRATARLTVPPEVVAEWNKREGAA